MCCRQFGFGSLIQCNYVAVFTYRPTVHSPYSPSLEIAIGVGVSLSEMMPPSHWIPAHLTKMPAHDVCLSACDDISRRPTGEAESFRPKFPSTPAILSEPRSNSSEVSLGNSAEVLGGEWTPSGSDPPRSLPAEGRSPQKFCRSGNVQLRTMISTTSILVAMATDGAKSVIVRYLLATG